MDKTILFWRTLAIILNPAAEDHSMSVCMSSQGSEEQSGHRLSFQQNLPSQNKDEIGLRQVEQPPSCRPLFSSSAGPLPPTCSLPGSTLTLSGS